MFFPLAFEVLHGSPAWQIGSFAATFLTRSVWYKQSNTNTEFLIDVLLIPIYGVVVNNFVSTGKTQGS